MQKFEIIIKNADGSIYWRQGFDTKRLLNEWLNEEKTRTYWKKEFTTEVIDNTDALKVQEDAWKAAQKVQQDAEKAAQKVQQDAEKAARMELKVLREKKNKTLADAVAMLEKIIDHLGLAKE